MFIYLPYQGSQLDFTHLKPFKNMFQKIAYFDRIITKLLYKYFYYYLCMGSGLYLSYNIRNICEITELVNVILTDMPTTNTLVTL